jgi:DNA mismatch endonuclease (patch repair protein)
MVDRPPASSPAVREFMRTIGRKDTAPELALRRELHARGVRFRLHRRDLPGRPDVVLVRLRMAVFVDGCFWHACPDHGVAPKANAQWWAAKLDANRARDHRNDEILAALGWTAVHVWEHEEPAVVADRLAAAWRTHPGSTCGI